ncbi:MAG: NAD(P)/FAD-dependent oxidoreductase, partial [Bacteroidia bacterium]
MPAAIDETQLPRIVIIGGGFGGLELIKTLKNAAVQVVLIDKHNYHGFQPLFYQVATGGLEPDSVATPFRKIFEGQKNFVFRMARVVSINAQKKIIRTTIGNVNYDFLVLATGSKTNFFGLEGVSDKAMPLKTIPQALDLRSLILQNFEKALQVDDMDERKSLMNIVVVGGGPTGVEVSGALAELKRHVLPNDYPELDIRQMRIYLIEAADKLLSGMSEKSSMKSKKFLVDLGVEIWLNVSVKSYDGMKVQLSNGKTILTRSLIWSAGVMGNTIEGLEKAVGKQNRFLVDDYNSVVSYENIYAIGDLAAMVTERSKHPHPMVAPVAVQQGNLLGKNIIRQLKGKEIKPFNYKDKGTMATVGRNRAVVDLDKINIQGFLAWFIWMFVHIMQLVSFRNRLVVFINWMWNYFSYDRAV